MNHLKFTLTFPMICQELILDRLSSSLYDEFSKTSGKLNCKLRSQGVIVSAVR